MKNVILFDSDARENLLPLTFTRPVADLRLGILSISKKWEKWLDAKVSYITQDYLTKKYPINISEDNFVINGSVLPSDWLFRLIGQLDFNEALLQDGELIAARLNESQFEHLIHDEEIEELQGFDVEETPFIKIDNLCDLFINNGQAIREDFALLTKDRESQPISDTNRIIGGENIFIEEGASVECAILNASEGPIYIGKNAQVMEGAMIRGPFALCDHAIVKMGAKVYGGTTVGPYSKVAGEVSNAILMGYSNKAHDGYLGNSVLGEWCNIGADTNTSNLKNNYTEVKLWNYNTERFLPTGEQFCGLILGDHSKCGINTMFNTGTVIGVSANIFGPGFPRNFIPSFSWGGASGYSTYTVTKAFDTAEKAMARRNVKLSAIDKSILENVFQQTAKYRRWDKVSVQ
jgi:UDP-N-acetylglucosamine diphosphorylase/glucosamine-1-phosphate N-acetyltransferase